MKKIFLLRWAAFAVLVFYASSAIAANLGDNPILTRRERLEKISLPSEAAQKERILLAQDKSRLISSCAKIAASGDQDAIELANYAIGEYVPTTSTLKRPKILEAYEP